MFDDAVEQQDAADKASDDLVHEIDSLIEFAETKRQEKAEPKPETEVEPEPQTVEAEAKPEPVLVPAPKPAKEPAIKKAPESEIPADEVMKPEKVAEAEPEAEAEAEAEPEIEELRKTNKALIDQINAIALSRGMSVEGAIRKEEPKKEEQKPAEQQKQQEPVKRPQQEDGEINFVNEEEAMELINDPIKLNRMLNKVYAHAVEVTLRRIPQLTVPIVAQYVNLDNEVRAFYEKNPDLASLKGYCGSVANEVAAQHPDWPPAKVFEETASEARKRLGMAKEARQVAKPTQRPALAPASKGGMIKPKAKTVKELEDEIGETIGFPL